MTINLPEELERFVRIEVQSGRFVSEDEAIAEALRLLRRRQPIASSRPLSEQEFEEKLTQSGFLGSVPSQPSGASPAWNFRAISIQGEPLSETIIRERR